MAQYDSTSEEISNSIGSTHGQDLSDAILSLLQDTVSGGGGQDTVDGGSGSDTVSPTVDVIDDVDAAQNSNADILIFDLGEDTGSEDQPLQFDDSQRAANNEGGRAYVFNGDKGVTAVFNTVERVIVGTSGADDFTVQGDKNTTVAGGEGNDTITSSGGNDSITGGLGNDSIASGSGNDSVYGGSGEDSTSFSGNQADYTVSQDGAITSVTNNSTGDVTQVVNAETLNFADGDMSVEQTAEVQALVTLYKQMFGDSATRTDGQADLDGLQYWAGQISSGELTLGGAIQSMLSSQESGFNMDALDMSSAADRETAVNLLYTELLGRTADSEGRDYWLNALENGTTLQDVAQAVSDSAEFQDLTVTETSWDFIL